MTRARRLMLEVAGSDLTCARAVVRGREVWVCRCIHCRARLVLPLDVHEPASATLEHIVPRTHGGSDELENLALACASCNHAKGRSIDHRPASDPTFTQVVERLAAIRRANMRNDS